MDCPCGSQKTFDDCCGPYISGARPAPTAEALMRSRYTAYARETIDYIIDTTWAAARKGVDPKATAKWARESTWLGLEIVSTERGREGDESGIVEFRARYRQKDGEFLHHERSTFKREDGRWYFVDGEPVKGQPVVAGPKIGRNEPCPCGSGKKYKKCCGQ